MQIFFLFVSFVLSAVFFAAGMSLFLAPIGLAMDLIDPTSGWNGLTAMLGLAGCAGLAFASGMAWYSRHLDNELVMPDPLPGEYLRFRQFGYMITDKKYDPARLVVTSQRLFILPTHFNAGPRLQDFVAGLPDLTMVHDDAFGSALGDKEVQVLKDRSFGEDIAGRFLLLKFKKKLVFYCGGNKIAYMPNLGYPLPSLKLFRSVANP